MKLQIFKTLWGHSGGYEEAACDAMTAHFDGIEAPIPQHLAEQSHFADILENNGLLYIAEVCTAGSYVPERHADVDDHLASLASKLRSCVYLKPEFVNCIGGCDAWSLDQHLTFFRGAMQLADDYGVVISFETHRSRSLFNPWITQSIVAALPAIRLTCDFSHWCVVCERLIDSELDVINAIAANAFHIHARVGYDQGPQVPHPAAPEYAECLRAHQSWWEIIWRAQHQSGFSRSTMTPEFGPDGYLHLLPYTQKPVADLWEINRWMASTEKQHFFKFKTQLAMPG
jgi:sugar phosphate isomerase/epimerase